jgi:hypothetical protein
MRHISLSLFLGFFLVSLHTLCADPFEGEYTVKGYDHYEKIDYVGDLTITKDKNNIYRVKEVVEGNVYTGTGLVCCSDTLVMAVRGPTLIKDAELDLNLMTFKVHGNNLKSTWVLIKRTLIGTEELTRKAIRTAQSEWPE